MYSKLLHHGQEEFILRLQKGFTTDIPKNQHVALDQKGSHRDINYLESKMYSIMFNI